MKIISVGSTNRQIDFVEKLAQRHEQKRRAEQEYNECRAEILEEFGLRGNQAYREIRGATHVVTIQKATYNRIDQEAVRAAYKKTKRKLPEISTEQIRVTIARLFDADLDIEKINEALGIDDEHRLHCETIERERRE